MALKIQIHKFLTVSFVALSLSACTAQPKEPPKLNANGWSEQTWRQVYIDETPPQPADHDPRNGMFHLPNVHVAPQQQDGWQVIDNYDADNFVMPQSNAKPQYNEIVPWGHTPQKAPAPEPKTVPSISHSVTVNDVSAALGSYSGTSQYQPSTQTANYNNIAMGIASNYHVIFYPHGITRLASADHKYVTDLAHKVAQHKQTYIRIVGHASSEVFSVKDPVKKKMINLEVAMKRAINIAKIFQQKGIAPEWVEIVSLGDTVPNRQSQQRKQNAADRRAEIFIQSR